MKDCLFENGMIFTSDDTNLYADAMLVSDGTIQWIGKREAIAEGDYERVNLKGACVVPGFIYAPGYAGRFQQKDFCTSTGSPFD